MMIEIVSVAYGVISMISWGCSDFLAKMVVTKYGYFRLLLYTQIVALAPVLLVPVFFSPQMPSSMRSIGLLFGSAICYCLSLLSLYKALSVGRVSIVSPVSSSWAIVAIIFSFVILGEMLSFDQILSISLIIAGILILSIKSDSSRQSNSGISYALLCMFVSGLNAVLIKLLSAEIGEAGTLFFNRIVVAAILVLILPFSHTIDGSPLRHAFSKSVVLVALTELSGVFSFIVGIGTGIVSIVTPVASASPAATVTLAQIFLREKLVRIQYVGIILTIAGIILLSIVSNI